MKYYRLLAMLPSLPDGPEAPPISLQELSGNLLDGLSESDRKLALALLGFLDCRNVEARLRGFSIFDERAPLSAAVLEDREDLPSWLQSFFDDYDSGVLADDYPFDALWRAYYGFLAQLAETSRSAFLADWTSYEISLADTLVRMRAERLGESADQRASGVPIALGEDHTALLSALGEADNPMERERLLDAARLRKIEAINGIDPFSTDAALAYLAAIMILDRWDIGKKADAAEMLEVFA